MALHRLFLLIGDDGPGWSPCIRRKISSSPCCSCCRPRRLRMRVLRYHLAGWEGGLSHEGGGIGTHCGDSRSEISRCARRAARWTGYVQPLPFAVRHPEWAGASNPPARLQPPRALRGISRAILGDADIVLRGGQRLGLSLRSGRMSASRAKTKRRASRFTMRWRRLLSGGPFMPLTSRVIW